MFSKNCHSYLPPSSCHPKSVFKGIARSIGTRLRMLVSNDEQLKERIQEYARYLTLSGWQYNRAIKEISQGATKPREAILHQPRKKQGKKIAWVTKFDPRAPSRSDIIKRNLPLLYSNPENRSVFPRKSLIAADRRLKNLGEIYKPTVPRRMAEHGPRECPGFFKCSRKCDTCRHAEETHELVSPWDGRRWKIRQHLTCTTANVIYVIRCKLHPQQWYVGSTTNLKLRWANHKSDVNRNKTNKCMVAQHVNMTSHPSNREIPFLTICPIEAVSGGESSLLRRELYWQANLGTLFTGLNCRKDLNAVLKSRVQYQNT